jgi:hypothetical protein
VDQRNDGLLMGQRIQDQQKQEGLKAKLEEIQQMSLQIQETGNATAEALAQSQSKAISLQSRVDL